MSISNNVERNSVLEAPVGTRYTRSVETPARARVTTVDWSRRISRLREEAETASGVSTSGITGHHGVDDAVDGTHRR
jgi:hypothetical protein